MATSLKNLAELYRVQGKYADSEPLYLRALKIDEKALGREHPGVATDMNNLALLYNAQGKHAEAKPLFKCALKIFQKAYGKYHPLVCAVCDHLAECCRKTGEQQ